MASSWFNSWLRSWGNSWGSIVVEETGGGGPSVDYKKERHVRKLADELIDFEEFTEAKIVESSEVESVEAITPPQETVYVEDLQTGRELLLEAEALKSEIELLELSFSLGEIQKAEFDQKMAILDDELACVIIALNLERYIHLVIM